MNGAKPDLRGNSRPSENREARLGEALRENLRKRKAVARARKARGVADDGAAQVAEGADPATTPPDSTDRT